MTVKFIGALRHAAGAYKLSVNCRKGYSVRGLITEVTAEAPELKRNLVNAQLGDQGLNALILVNSKEISALNGLETELKDGDEVVLIPVVHGG